MTDRIEPPEAHHERALSRALREQAETVRPAGDGLANIQARVARRRRLLHWVAPLASAATVTAVVLVVALSGVLSPDRTAKLGQPATSPPPHPPTLGSAAPQSSGTAPTSSTVTTSAVSVRATATTPPPSTPAPISSPTVVATRPATAVPFWPFASRSLADGWTTSAANSPAAWQRDPRGVAERFVGALETGLGLPHPTLGGSDPVLAVDDDTARVDVTRTGSGGQLIVLGTVTLARWSPGFDAPWGVVGVTSPVRSYAPLAITAPLAGATVTGPLPVRFTLTGAEDDVYTGAWAAAATTPASRQQSATGSAATVTLPVLPTGGSGFVAVVDGSAASGTFQISRLAVTPVHFAAGTTEADTYVAVVDAKLQVIDATTGTVVRTLAAGTPYAINDVTNDGTWAYYSTITQYPYGETCRQPIRRVRVDGSGAPEIAVPWTTRSLSGMAVGGPHNAVQAWLEIPCTGQQPDAPGIRWRNTDTGASGEITSPSNPPRPDSLAISPDGTKITAFLWAGTQGNLATFVIPAATTVDQGSVPAGCTSDGSFECVASAYVPLNGDLLIVRADGQHLSVLQEHEGKGTPMFSVTPAGGTGQYAQLDVDAATGRILLMGGNGQAWLYDGGGKPIKLPGTITDASW